MPYRHTTAGLFGIPLPGILLPSLLGIALCTGCMDSGPREEVAVRIARIDKARLRAHVAALTAPGPRSVDRPNALRHSVDYLKMQLAHHGYQPVEEPVNRMAGEGDVGHAFVNILAEHPGAGAFGRILELDAHYDTVVGSPGADDNASAVAAILEIARVMAGLRLRHRVRFCFFALEETGRDGSRLHVRRIRERDEDLEGAIILEMVGYATDRPDSQATPLRVPLLFWPPATGDFVAVVGNFRSGGLGNRFERAAATYVPELPYFSANRVGGLLRDALRSDHKPYWDHDYRAIMLTDTANFRNPHYHRPEDTVETLNFDFLQGVARAAAATLLEWADPVSAAGDGGPV
ncbi:MAG: M20/M25/M40 family metallo-hydrolase [Gammaproteobacteria bacterium]